jgi:F-type H+-transporting ATPase subunit b
MAHLLQQLQGIIVRALPTFFVFILLHWYLKKVLFQPMERVLAQRRNSTEGVIEASEASIRAAAEKTRAYESKMAEARAEIYREQEQNRKQLRETQRQAVADARARFGERVGARRTEIEAEAQAARAGLETEAGRLAEQIAGAVLAGKA